MNKSQAAKDILKKQSITSWFQPIINISTKELIGWEAFSRAPSVSPFESTPSLFDSAAEAGVLKPLDLLCMHSAAQCFEQLQLDNKLFVNLSSEIILASGKLKEQVGELIRDSSVSPTRMVLELDARSASSNVQALFSAVDHFQKQGFEIAINDVGASGSSQYLWAELKPDYVKIDRCFVTGINADRTKQQQVKNIVAAAHSLNAKVIAKGVETEDELLALQELGVKLVQGYLIQKPELSPLPPNMDKISPDSSQASTVGLACDLAIFHDKIEASSSVENALESFEENIALGSIAVVDKDKAVGMLYRTSFLAKLSSPQRRKVLLENLVTSEMETGFLNVDSHQHLEQVVRMITSRARLHAEQDFVVSNGGKFLGIGTVVDLLKKVSESKTASSEGVNVLSMLPGNIPIADRVNELLESGTEFTIALLDLTNFKPFNNHYGYTKGDELLVMFAELLRKHLSNETDFAGHLGGDDFVVISSHTQWQSIFSSVLSEFLLRSKDFYSKDDLKQSGIQTTDRLGEGRLYGMVSISAGVLSVKDEYFDSFQTVLKRIIQLKQKTRKDKSLHAAHQHQDCIDYYAFEENLLSISSSETLASAS